MKPRIDPQRWKQIDDLLDAAIDLEPEKRSSYLDQACGNDQDLRKKVQELLKSDLHAEDFISLPVLDPASEYLDHKIELHERDVIADRYELVSRLGTGGMGEVWLAFDLKLRVHVVLKTLHFHLNRAPHRIEALRREVLNARTVISPNVCRIFDLVIDHDREFISMEHIDGMTLAAVLKSTGPLPLSKARDIASQFLSGLQVIHDAGLVHCDLKPENIMITHTGRVVVMDFGIAKQKDQTRSMISGTPAYMSPEQLCGAAVDPKTDLFAAGIILAEMIHPEGIVTDQTREEIWNMIRQDPPQLADGPWKSVITRAVAPHPEDRFHSATVLLRKIEEATEQMQTQHERSPYPGLASYRIEDADYFFGREQEVEAVIKKIKQLHFLALVGASGSGKTSFLRAGLIPALPEGWSYIFCVPADSPHLNLKHALIRQFSDDPEALQQLSRFDEAEVAVQLLHQWRRKYTEVVLIIDRFEEIFTLNGTDTQSRFADLIGAAVLKSDIHVLFSMRDDFLIRCHHYPPLAPIFSGLTPLESLSGPSLRRALVQPALRCGYAFEDETLIDEIVADVEKERGALPLMAFAAAQLWKKRDRDSGVLTRKAYKEIGGVGGALAQHAEKTLERVGAEKQDTVREIFRNLITAQNTRAARDTEELLSVFTDQQKAEEVLRILIDARLLTSFEEPPQDGEKPKRRVVMIHESLLAAWPRLVRWQTQEAESAQLRDQLRQASQVWAERGRSDDLLWTGAAYLEFQLWRQRYPGGLSSNENAFAQAMANRANKHRRNRRIAAATMFVVLLGVLLVFINLWQREKAAKENANLEARRAEARRVLVLGRTDQAADNNTKLAYAIASLELSDTNEARSFALQALSEMPPARIMKTPMHPPFWLEFSPDGKWMAAGGFEGIQLLSSNGSPPIVVTDHRTKPLGRMEWPHFSPNGEFLIWASRENPTQVNLWSLSQKKVVRTFHLEGYTGCEVINGDALFITDTSRREWKSKWGPGRIVMRIWKFDQQQPNVVAAFDVESMNSGFLSHANWIIEPKGGEIYLRSTDPKRHQTEQLLGKHAAEEISLSPTFPPAGNEIASMDAREIRLWSTVPGIQNPVRVIPSRDISEKWWDVWFDSRRKFLLVQSDTRFLRWDLTAPVEAEPMAISHRNEESFYPAFDREGRWMAISWATTLAFYPLNHPYPYIFRDPQNVSASTSFNVRFTADGKSLVNGFNGDGIRIWNLSERKQSQSRILWKPVEGHVLPIDVDPGGRYVLAGTNAANDAPGVHLISMADGQVKSLKRCLPARIYDSVAISPDGRFGAAVAVHDSPDKHGIEMWNLESGNCDVIEESKRKASFVVKYAPDGSLFSGDSRGNLYQWNLKENSNKVRKIGKGIVTGLAITNDGRYIAASALSAQQWNEVALSTAELVIHDLKQNKTTPITSHGNRIFRVAFDPAGKTLVTGDLDGNVRVGPINGDPPHLLIGHDGHIGDVAVHPGGEWIASTGFNKAEVRLWPMPKGKPFHTLPKKEFVTRLRALTNVRVIEDKRSSTGYRIDVGPFPGWEKLPSW